MRHSPRIAQALLFIPALAGLLGLILPAFGVVPALGMHQFSLEFFQNVLNWSGFGRAIWLSVSTGIAATIISLISVALFLASCHDTKVFRTSRRLLAPLLALPHAAAAFGFAFLIMPSGFLARLISPWGTGWHSPPDILVIADPWGIAMTLGLVLKEVPFLLMMNLAILGNLPIKQHQEIAASAGYAPVIAWLKMIFPLWYRQIRMPVLVVLVFSMTAIEPALILGPSLPPPLAIQILDWFNDPDLSKRSLAAAAAVILLMLTLASCALWVLGEKIVAQIGFKWVWSGSRSRGALGLKLLGSFLAPTLLVTLLASLIPLIIWSIAGLWRFPEIVPQSLSAAKWMQHLSQISEIVGDTLCLAALTSAVALIFAVLLLEKMPHIADSVLLYLPLLIPQIVFLPGLQMLFLNMGLRSGWLPVFVGHLIFVFPYVVLTLRDMWRAWDARFAAVAQGLGAAPVKILFHVKLPMLFSGVITALAVGMAVSVSQYLPTLLLGGGRLNTVTTEAIALASGGDRRVISIWALAQLAAAALPFVLAITLPRLIFRNRKGMLHD